MQKNIDSINAILPQTQCELCSYQGCLPYAEAIVNKGERIDRCEPGGIKTLREIAAITKQDATALESGMQKKTKTITHAVIREHECIGCTKCIQACPVDAIIGSGKKMHTVLTDICNGCELCVPPCPVDCIDLLPHPKYNDAHEIREQSRERFEKHKRRLATKRWDMEVPKKGSSNDRKAAIQAAIARKNKDS